MLIVSDTGPLRYLCEICVVNVLPQLYGRVLTTPQVVKELQLPYFPELVRSWALQPPLWLTVENPRQISFLDQLDEGEASALSLATERRADAVLIDERKGTSVARSSGLATIGTLAVLQEAGHARLLDFHASIRKLTQETRFRHQNELIDRVIADYEAEKDRRQREGKRTRSGRHDLIPYQH